MPDHDGFKSLAVHCSPVGGAGDVEDVVDGGLLRVVVAVVGGLSPVVVVLIAEFLVGWLVHPARRATTPRAATARTTARFTGWSLADHPIQHPRSQLSLIFPAAMFWGTPLAANGGPRPFEDHPIISRKHLIDHRRSATFGLQDIKEVGFPMGNG